MNDAAANVEWVIESPPEAAAALLLAAIFLGSVLAAWYRLGRNARARWTARWTVVVILNATACLAILALLAPPALLRPSSDTVTLLTEGAPSSAATGADAYVAPGGGDYGRRPEYLLDVGQMPLREPALGALTIAGHGLETGQWRQLPDDAAILYAEPPPLVGLVAPAWERSLLPGQALIVAGRYVDSEPGNATSLELVDPAGIAVAAHDLAAGADFELIAQPKAPGLIDYRLRVLGNEGELHSEPVPVHVRTGKRPVLYVMQSAPSFETRQLRNWAGGSGTTVVMDTVITQGRELRQLVNAGDLTDDGLSPALLGATALAVVDGRAWAGLDSMRRDWFEAAVREGMGLLILADGDLADYLVDGDTLLQGFELVERERDQDGYLPSWESSTSTVRLPLLGLALGYGSGGALVSIESGEVVEAYRNVGLGRVAVSVLRERHRWLTSGDEATYTAYWARLMGRIGRPAPLPFLLPAADDAWPRPHRRMRLCAMTQSMAHSAGVSFEVAPMLAESSLALESAAPSVGGPRRCAGFWPWQPGWHRVRLFAGDANAPLDEAFYYVFDDNQWRAQWRHSRQLATMRRAAAIDRDRSATMRTARVDIHPIWPWLVLVVSAGLLWLERRLYD